MGTRFDVLIIGPGAVGCMIARQKPSIGLLERANDVATSASSNSSIIHCGHDPIPGSKKRLLNRRGNALWKPKVAKKLDVPFVLPGSLIIAAGSEEFPSFGPQGRNR